MAACIAYIHIVQFYCWSFIHSFQFCKLVTFFAKRCIFIQEQKSFNIKIKINHTACGEIYEFRSLVVSRSILIFFSLNTSVWELCEHIFIQKYAAFVLTVTGLSFSTWLVISSKKNFSIALPWLLSIKSNWTEMNLVNQDADHLEGIFALDCFQWHYKFHWNCFALFRWN